MLTNISYFLQKLIAKIALNRLCLSHTDDYDI